jgi:hypothetical protein
MYKHENIDVEGFVKLLPLVSKPNRRSEKVIQIAKGLYKKRKPLFRLWPRKSK